MGRMATDNTQQSKFTAQIGARLQELRTQAGISRAQAAREIGVSEQAYANREIGTTEVKSHEIVVLSDLFRVSPRMVFADIVPADADPGLAWDSGFAKLADEAEELLRLFNRIADPEIRHAVAEAVRALARADEDI